MGWVALLSYIHFITVLIFNIIFSSGEQVKPMEEKTLDALSLICQAVLLDHNYNATLPPDSPPRTLSTPNANSQMNGVSSGSMYSPGIINEI